MEQQANYIRRIEIHGLWERFNIGWDLRPDVNILSGINGCLLYTSPSPRDCS